MEECTRMDWQMDGWTDWTLSYIPWFRLGGVGNKATEQSMCTRTFLAKCLKSSVLVIRPILQSGLRNGLRHATICRDILLRNWSLILLANSELVSAAAVVVSLPFFGWNMEWVRFHTLSMYLAKLGNCDPSQNVKFSTNQLVTHFFWEYRLKHNTSKFKQHKSMNNTVRLSFEGLKN